MMKLSRMLLVCSLLVSLPLAALSPKPAGPQQSPMAIVNATVHVGDGTVIKNGLVMFDEGIITGVSGEGATVPDGYEVLDGQGQHVYPGFILPNTRLGLTEVNNVRGTRDDVERGLNNASVRALVAYNTDSELIPTYRFNGVLTAQTTPVGGLIGGNSAIVQLDAWNWQDAAIVADDGLHLYWPKPQKTKTDFIKRTVQYELDDKYADRIEEIVELFADARAEPDSDNLNLQAVHRVLRGEARLYVHLDTARQIIDALDFAQDIPHVVLVGARQALLVADLIRSRKVPIIVQYVHGLPATADTPIDENFTRLGRFIDAGLTVGLASRMRQEPSSGRNLPFIAGTVIGYGVAPEKALQLITLDNARILGIDDQLGSLEVGKRATLFVSEGDALDIRGNRISAAFIDGRAVTIRGMQQELFERFEEKYRQR